VISPTIPLTGELHASYTELRRFWRGPALSLKRKATNLALELLMTKRGFANELRSLLMFKLTVILVTLALATVVAMGQAPTLQIVTPDGPNLPAELFYGNVKVKPLRLRPGTNQVITIDDSDFFTNQHYVDFLNRFPDTGGFNFWNSKFTNCAGNQACLNATRIDVSNQFFFVLEYQQTGAYVYRLYRAAFGNTQPFPVPSQSNPTEGNKLPTYANYKADRQQVVGGSNLTQQQQDLANAFVLRTEFLARYPASLSLDQFVTNVLAQMNSDLGADLTSQKNALVALGSRGAVMYRLADDNASNPINNKPLIDAEYNRAIVYTQYAGYLRRNVDIPGFLFWLGAINAGPLRDLGNQRTMVCNFITSAEYQLRFGSAVTHTNAEC
jgi:hypothetical protein